MGLAMWNWSSMTWIRTCSISQAEPLGLGVSGWQGSSLGTGSVEAFAG